MKLTRHRLGLLALAGALQVAYTAPTAQARNWYVAVSGDNSNSGTNWTDAKKYIQAGVNQAQAGDTVWVSNGVYDAGGRTVDGYALTNRVAITNDIDVRSVNGPAVTFIVGKKHNGGNGASAIRCAYIAAGARLIGFTLTNGATMNSGAAGREQGGGGAWCEPGGEIRRCIITGNSAAYNAGGVNGGYLHSCVLVGNTAAHSGGGASGAILYNCTVIRNASLGADGGGTHVCTNHNGIVYFNTAPSNPNYNDTVFRYSCTTPLPAGNGNIAGDPVFVSSYSYHLAAASPCIDVGNNAYATNTSTDVDGASRTINGAIDMGAEETAARGYVTVAANPSYGGSVSGSSWQYVGSSITISAAGASPYWGFVNWSDGVLTSGRTITVNGSAAYTANFRRVAGGLTLYVAPAGWSVSGAGTNWATAKRTIQEAVDDSYAGDTILVSNGVCATGGRALSSGPTNRVSVTNAIAIRSVNGPSATTIMGAGPLGPAAVRGVYLTNGASLSGFTITNGYTLNTTAGNVRQEGGGGVYAESGATVSNCILAGNSAKYWGGGQVGGRLFNSAVHGNNSGYAGGGACSSLMTHCTVVDNSAGSYGGGTFRNTNRNSIICFNTGPTGPDDSGSSNAAVCIAGTNVWPGVITNDPALATIWRLATNSPLVAAGISGFATGKDVDGEAWLTPPALGCDQPTASAATGSMGVSIYTDYSLIAVDFPAQFRLSVAGKPTETRWNFGDGTGETNRPITSHAWSQTGVFAVVCRAINLSYPAGLAVTTTIQVIPAPRFVALGGSNTPPYNTWGRAATNIQDAVDSAPAGAFIFVSNGVYATGGRAVYSNLLNRVAVTRPMIIQSMNGPGVTTIKGVGPVGTNAVRCVYLTNDAVLIGFTLTNGATRSTGGWEQEKCGGGAWLASGAVLSNCVVAGNEANMDGGGIFVESADRELQATVFNSQISGNVAKRGAGAFRGRVYGCRYEGNRASGEGGGSWDTASFSCLLYNNRANVGGGSYAGEGYGSTIAGNFASNSAGGVAGGYYASSVIYSNTSPNTGTANFATTNAYGSLSARNSCSFPLLPGENNFTNNPGFVSAATGEFHLTPTSPLIDAGEVVAWMTGYGRDLEGRERVLGGGVDIGAYEFRYELTMRALLSGPYLSNGMMRVAGLLSSNSPYAGAACAAAVPTNAVDWVLVSMRPTPTGAPSRMASALLLSDGSIVSQYGGTHIGLETKGNQHLVLQHRDHLAVMTANALTSRNADVDFSTNVLGVLGTTDSMAPLDGGRWGLIPGDADGDGVIHDADDAIRRTQEAP